MPVNFTRLSIVSIVRFKLRVLDCFRVTVCKDIMVIEWFLHPVCYWPISFLCCAVNHKLSMGRKYLFPHDLIWFDICSGVHNLISRCFTSSFTTALVVWDTLQNHLMCMICLKLYFTSTFLHTFILWNIKYDFGMEVIGEKNGLVTNKISEKYLLLCSVIKSQ